jgi:hypothetical protein
MFQVCIGLKKHRQDNTALIGQSPRSALPKERTAINEKQLWSSGSQFGRRMNKHSQRAAPVVSNVGNTQIA